MWQPPRSKARLEFCCQNLRIHSQLHLSHGREPGGEHEELFPGLFPSQIPPSCFHSSDRDANQTHLAWSCSLFQKKVLLGGRKYPTLAWGGKQILKNFLPPTSFLPFLNTLEQNVTTAAPAPDSCENTSCNRNENKVKTNQGKKKPQTQRRRALPWLRRSGNFCVFLGKGRALPGHDPAQSHQQLSPHSSRFPEVPDPGPALTRS